MKLRDLVRNPKDGRLSSTKLATATTYGLFSFWFCVFNGAAVRSRTKQGADAIPWLAELWWAFMAVALVAAGHQSVVSKLVAVRGQPQAPGGGFPGEGWYSGEASPMNYGPTPQQPPG